MQKQEQVVFLKDYTRELGRTELRDRRRQIDRHARSRWSIDATGPDTVRFVTELCDGMPGAQAAPPVYGWRNNYVTLSVDGVFLRPIFDALTREIRTGGWKWNVSFRFRVSTLGFRNFRWDNYNYTVQELYDLEAAQPPKLFQTQPSFLDPQPTEEDAFKVQFRKEVSHLLGDARTLEKKCLAGLRPIVRALPVRTIATLSSRLADLNVPQPILSVLETWIDGWTALERKVMHKRKLPHVADTDFVQLHKINSQRGTEKVTK